MRVLNADTIAWLIHVFQTDLEINPAAIDWAGFRRAAGWPVGQVADYKGPVYLQNGRRACVHIRAYEGYVEAHMDWFDALTNPIMHFIFDVIPWLLGFGVR